MAAAAGSALVHAPTAANGKAPMLRHQVRQNTLRVACAVSRRAGESQPTLRMGQPFPIRLQRYKGRKMEPKLYCIRSLLSLPVLCHHSSCQCKSDVTGNRVDREFRV